MSDRPTNSGADRVGTSLADRDARAIGVPKEAADQMLETA
jgi:hypothetical protein